MDWDFISISAVAEASSGNLTLNAPTGAQKGDLLIACIGYRSNAAFTPPVGAGWNLVATQQSSGDTDATSGIASGGMWYLVRGVSNPSFAFTRTAGDVAEGFVLCYRNCTSSPYDTGVAETRGTLGEPTATAISTAEANELLVAMVVSGDNNEVNTFDAATNPSTASGSVDTTTEPTADTWIQRLLMTDTTGADIGVAIADGIKATAGSTGTFSAIDATATTRSVFIVGAFKQLPTIQPSVYESATVADPAAGIVVSISEAPKSINVYDEANAEDYLSEVDNENLGPVNVNSEVSIDEFIDSLSSIADINISDSITVTDEPFLIFDLACNVYDETTVTEDTPISVSAAEKIIEDFEIFLSTSISPYDQVTVTEFITAKIDAETSIFDTVTVSESVTIENVLGGINVSDLIGITEYIVTSVSYAGISVSDTITLTEDVNVVVEAVTVYFVNVSDSTSVSENVVISNELCYTSVFDTVTVSEDADVLVEVIGELYTSVYDSVSVTEFITAVVPTISTSVNDSVSVLEQVTLSVSSLVLSTSDTVTITESITSAASISGINVIDLVSVTDVDSVSIPFCQTNIFDSITTAEQVTSAINIPGINVSDSTSIEDVATVIPEGAVVHLNISGIFELVTVSEVIFRSLSDLARQVYDSVSVSEYKNASINISGINVSDTVTVVDYTSAVVSVPSYIYISGIYETVTISEAVTTRLSDLPAITYDSVSVSETIEVAPDVIVTAYETVTVNEQVLILNTVNVSIFDTSGISESVSVILDYGVNVSDTVNVRELVSGVGGELSSSVFDTVSIRDWGYIYWLLAAGRLEVNCEGLGISVDTLGFMDRIGVDGIEIDIEALGI